MVDYGKFEKSLRHLEAQLQNHRASAGRPELGEIDREAIAESVVQRFKICYGCLLEILKHHLRETLGIPDLPDSPKPLLRIAFENRLFPDVTRWLAYADARVATSHCINTGKTVATAFDFAGDAAELYGVITGKPWTSTQPLATAPDVTV